MGAEVAGAIVALDPAAGPDAVLYVTDGALAQAFGSRPVRVLSRAQLADALVGHDGRCALARRILSLRGQQLLWSLGLARRDSLRARRKAPSRPRPRRPRFID